MGLKSFIFVFFLFFMSNFVFAVTGVIPAKYEIDFAPDFEKDFSFNFVNDFEESLIYIEGDLSEFFTIKSDNKIGSNRMVVVTMKLPNVVQKAGKNRVRVGCREINSLDGVSVTMDVRGVIDINVPYPNKYADIEFNINYANKGDDALYNLTIYNRGEDNVSVRPRLELKSSGKLIDVIYLEEKEIKSLLKENYIGKISTDDYLAGDYNITAVVDYGGDLPRSETKIFRLGELNMKILNYTTDYKRNGLNRINVIVESSWNNEISDVYVNGSIVGYPHINFKSPSFSIDAWGSRVFQTYFDTTGIYEENFQIDINVVYEGIVTTQRVNVGFVKETNWLLIILISISVIIILLIVSVLLIIGEKKSEKK